MPEHVPAWRCIHTSRERKCHSGNLIWWVKLRYFQLIASREPTTICIKAGIKKIKLVWWNYRDPHNKRSLNPSQKVVKPWRNISIQNAFTVLTFVYQNILYLHNPLLRLCKQKGYLCGLFSPWYGRIIYISSCKTHYSSYFYVIR